MLLILFIISLSGFSPRRGLIPDFKIYSEYIKQDKINNVEFNYIQNKNNELSQLNFIFEMGRLNMKELTIAILNILIATNAIIIAIDYMILINYINISLLFSEKLKINIYLMI